VEGGLSLTLRVEAAGRPDLWLGLAANGDLEDALAARAAPLLPGGGMKRLTVLRFGPALIEFEARLEGDAPAGPSASVPLGTLFPAPGDLAGLILPAARTAPVSLDLCGEVTQTLRFDDSLTPAGLVSREAAPEPPGRGSPVTRSRWSDDGTWVRTLRGSVTRIRPEDWPAVRAELAAWLQDEARRVVLLPGPPPAEAPRP